MLLWTEECHVLFCIRWCWDVPLGTNDLIHLELQNQAGMPGKVAQGMLPTLTPCLCLLPETCGTSCTLHSELCAIRLTAVIASKYVTIRVLWSSVRACSFLCLTCSQLQMCLLLAPNFWNEDRNKTENTLEQFCQLLVFLFASSDSHWFGETSLSWSRQWACAQ